MNTIENIGVEIHFFIYFEEFLRCKHHQYRHYQIRVGCYPFIFLNTAAVNLIKPTSQQQLKTSICVFNYSLHKYCYHNQHKMFQFMTAALRTIANEFF